MNNGRILPPGLFFSVCRWVKKLSHKKIMLLFKLFLPTFLYPTTIYCFDYYRSLLKLLTIIFLLKKNPREKITSKLHDVQRARIKGNKNPSSGFELQALSVIDREHLM